MGVIVREKDPGEWWIFINHNGRRKSKKIGRDEKTAIDAAKMIGAKLILGDLQIIKEEKDCPTFKECASRWLETVVRPDKRKGTYRAYESSLRIRIYPVLGNVPVDRSQRK